MRTGQKHDTDQPVRCYQCIKCGPDAPGSELLGSSNHLLSVCLGMPQPTHHELEHDPLGYAALTYWFASLLGPGEEKADLQWLNGWEWKGA